MPFVEVDRDEERVYVTIEFFDGTERDAKLVVEATEVRIENLPTVLGSHRIALPVAVDAHRAEERRRNAVVTLEIPRASEGASGKA
jgi:HSP20 family molecular chaperone IbpA